jgi:hypothetical protein
LVHKRRNKHGKHDNYRKSKRLFYLEKYASDPNQLTLIFKWNTIANAQKFAHSPELKASMDKAGVVGTPDIHFLNEA